MKLPDPIVEAAAVYELFPSTDNAKAFVDEISKWLIREIVSKAVADLLMAKLDEGFQDGGMVALPDYLQATPRLISTKCAPSVVTEIQIEDVCGYCGVIGHRWGNCPEGPF